MTRSIASGARSGPSARTTTAASVSIRQRLEATAQRCAHAALPLIAVNDARVSLEPVRALDDDELVHGAGPNGPQHVRRA